MKKQLRTMFLFGVTLAALVTVTTVVVSTALFTGCKGAYTGEDGGLGGFESSGTGSGSGSNTGSSNGTNPFVGTWIMNVSTEAAHSVTFSEGGIGTYAIIHPPTAPNIRPLSYYYNGNTAEVTYAGRNSTATVNGNCLTWVGQGTYYKQ
jgi:hypothetical protein